MSYEETQRRLLRVFEAADQDDSCDDSGSDFEIDNVGQRSSESDSEQEVGLPNEEENEAEGSEERESNDNRPYFTGKNGTKWFSVPERSNVRTRSENIIRERQGVKDIGKNAKTAVECWKLFLTDEILQEILLHTNSQINLKRTACENSHVKKYIMADLSSSELKAFIGLLYLAGQFKANKLNLKDLWISDGSGVEIFRTTMTLKRFQFIQNCLRFDDKNTRSERKATDNLAAIRSFFEKFVANCQIVYTPSEYTTIDEQLPSFRGRCSFRQYMPNKPNKYGLKIYALVDAKSFYVINLEIYPGKQPTGPYALSNKAYDVVDRLVAPISKTNRNVTFDNWFTSYPLMLHLLKEHRLTSTGTVRKNKPDIPSQMLQTRNREIPSTVFGFQKDISLLSHVPKKNKVVLLMSTLHHDDSVVADTNGTQKPEMIIFYNQTKGGVDVVDELCTNYDVSRNTKRWPMVIFYAVLNMAGINSIIVYKSNNSSNLSRRNFLRDLGIGLVSEHLQNRKENQHLPRELRKRILDQVDEPSHSQRPPNKVPKPIRRCQICPTKKDRKTKHTCYKCNRYLCMEHAVFTCQDCAQTEDDYENSE
ncbi:piggyBac transposable element-derived protein 4-like [Anastrepha ludens]|uniref:piggyBac transposable element-derived protein 4-like n=1 Tax=Anastrepha ludens TaxID=28586 RepID=UPI0023AEB1CA|nr:piggyBac transposable element-derived protein 4-like [Anastrepha ludens]